MINTPTQSQFQMLANKFGLAQVPQTLEQLFAALQQIMSPHEFELVKYLFMDPLQYQQSNPFGSPDLPGGAAGLAKDNAGALVTAPPAASTVPAAAATTPPKGSSTPAENEAVAAAAAKNAANQQAVQAAIKAAGTSRPTGPISPVVGVGAGAIALTGPGANAPVAGGPTIYGGVGSGAAVTKDTPNPNRPGVAWFPNGAPVGWKPPAGTPGFNDDGTPTGTNADGENPHQAMLPN